ncbi:hypothetical protein [Filimonas effusa]|uniref:Uncharacterized protein n=1 Tax=Filimonas effusa TaxID=2508721 RepID=A0A4Q1DBK8_9BACT|nr:hypothetical protein [Filimonas effusa]RXK85973.1 hypothetical protein ESB13_03950 [Filimonas effusa]
MKYNINIIISVDVVKALSDKTLHNSIYLMDDSPCASYGKGTANLVTRCLPGQTIKWTSYPVDLQTPVAISRIDFLPVAGVVLPPPGYPPQTGTGLQPVNPDLFEWTGIVPYYLVPGIPYYYRLQLEMGEGKNGTMHINTAAIMTTA